MVSYPLIDKNRFSHLPYQAQIDLLVSALEKEAVTIVKAHLSTLQDKVPENLSEDIAPFSQIAWEMAEAIKANPQNDVKLKSVDFQHHAQLVQLGLDASWTDSGRHKAKNIPDYLGRLASLRDNLARFGARRGVTGRKAPRVKREYHIA